MARAWRIEYEGAYYHLLSCGNERCDIFRTDAHYSLFLERPAEGCERFDIELCAYVLMPICLSEPGRRIFHRQCTGFAEPIRGDSTIATGAAGIYFKVASRACWCKMMPVSCSFPVISNATRCARD